MNSIKFAKILLSLLFLTTILSAQNVNKISSSVNKSGAKILSPHVSYDGTKLVYIINFKDSLKLAESFYNESSGWSEPYYIDSVNKIPNVYIESPSYNQDASEIYFSMKYEDKNSTSDIYLIKKIKNIWQNPVKLGAPINSGKFNEKDPCISPDGNTLYFVRNEENSKKGFECNKILFSEKKNGKWTRPKLLPEPVNGGCDRAPKIAADGTTLFISSVREGGKGGADIYYTKKLAKNVWLAPIPVVKVNTENDELFASATASGKLYFQKGQGKRRKRKEELVFSEIDKKFRPDKNIIITGTVTDLNTRKPTPAQINIIEPVSNVILSSFKNNDVNGKYTITLQNNKKYKIDIFNDGYSHYFFTQNTNNLNEYKIIKNDVKLYSEVKLLLNIYDNEIFEPLKVNIKVYDKETGKLINTKIEQKDAGRYILILPIGQNYRIEAENENFSANSLFLDLSGVVQFDEFVRDIELKVKKVDVSFNVTDSKTGAGVNTVIEITNKSTNEKIIINAQTDKEGKVTIKLRKGDSYEVNITPNGYSFHSMDLGLVEEEKKVDVKLDPLVESAKIKLNDINFESNSADLNESSFLELDRLVKLLKKNPQIKVELSAHTDDVGSKIYNLKLSDKRAKSVVEYLVDKGILPEKLVSKGYGESKPAYLPVTLKENRKRNRRVELKVTEVN